MKLTRSHPAVRRARRIGLGKCFCAPPKPGHFSAFICTSHLEIAEAIERTERRAAKEADALRHELRQALDRCVCNPYSACEPCRIARAVIAGEKP